MCDPEAYFRSKDRKKFPVDAEPQVETDCLKRLENILRDLNRPVPQLNDIFEVRLRMQRLELSVKDLATLMKDVLEEERRRRGFQRY